RSLSQNQEELWKCRGCGKSGKPKAGFQLFPQAPWKSRQKTARFPHSHSSGDEGGWKSGKPKAGFPLSHRLDSSLLKNKTTPPPPRPSPSARRGAARRVSGPLLLRRGGKLSLRP